MMREIKFRFWDTKDNEWMVDGRTQKNILDFAFLPAMNWSYITRDEAKERVIVEQYTGLKNKNGVEIYEGDIVRCKSKNWEVIHHNCGFTNQWVCSSGSGHSYVYPGYDDIEVIGNIHSNPELLEAK